MGKVPIHKGGGAAGGMQSELIFKHRFVASGIANGTMHEVASIEIAPCDELFCDMFVVEVIGTATGTRLVGKSWDMPRLDLNNGTFIGTGVEKLESVAMFNYISTDDPYNTPIARTLDNHFILMMSQGNKAIGGVSLYRHPPHSTPDYCSIDRAEKLHARWWIPGTSGVQGTFEMDVTVTMRGIKF